MFSTVLVLIFFGIIAAILIKPEKLTEAEKRERARKRSTKDKSDTFGKSLLQTKGNQEQCFC